MRSYNDEVHIYISESLNKNEMMATLEHILAGSTDILDLEKKLTEFLR